MLRLSVVAPFMHACTYCWRGREVGPAGKCDVYQNKHCSCCF